jgi:hypothetical protein
VRTTIKRDGTREYSIAYYKNFGASIKTLGATTRYYNILTTKYTLTSLLSI